MTHSEIFFFLHFVSFSNFPSCLPPRYFSKFFPLWVAIRFLLLMCSRIQQWWWNLAQTQFSVWNFTLSMLHSIFWIKYKETVVKDFLKNWFVFITGDLTNITVPCYTRKSNLGQRSMKEVAPVSNAFFSSSCFTLYYHVRSYKNKSKAIGLLANMILQHSKCLLEAFY